MGRRDLFLPLALALNLTACTEAVTPAVLPDVQNVTSTRSLGVPVAPEIAQAGCTIGRAIDESRSRILMLARSELPFRMPQMHTVQTTARGKVVYEMKKFALRPNESTRQQVFLSCIVPMFGDDSRQIARALAAIPNQQRLQVAERLEREGENVSEPLSLAIGNVLRKKLFPKSRLVSRGTSSDTTGMCCDPPRLGTIQVTARSSYSIITYASLAAFLSSFDEGSRFNHERYVDYEEWSRLCDDYQVAYWDWRSSQDQADAAASEMALTLTEIADALYTAAVELEGAEDSCQRVGAGKRLCIDFFIASVPSVPSWEIVAISIRTRFLRSLVCSCTSIRPLASGR